MFRKIFFSLSLTMLIVWLSSCVQQTPTISEGIFDDAALDQSQPVQVTDMESLTGKN